MKNSYVFIFICFCLVWTVPGCQKTSYQSKTKPYSSAQLQSAVEEYLEDKTNVLGTIVKVNIKDEKSYVASSGYIDSSRTIPIRPNTQFVIGSVTKIFTAVLVNQLIEHGQVQLQSPIIEYLPSEWSAILKKIEYGDEITVEQVLSHRSGIADVTNDEAFQRSLFLDTRSGVKPLDVIRIVQQSKETGFRPGSNFQYCNTNYILLGALIESVSGLSYRQVLQKNILDRVGLENTFLAGSTFGDFSGTIAYGYSEVEGALDDGNKVHVEWAHAAGGIISTAEDLITFYRALESGRLFDNAGTYRRMCQLVSHNENYGLGLEIVNDPDAGLYYGHRGNFMGTRTILAFFPQEQMTIVLCHTYTGFSMSHPADLLKQVVKWFRGEASAVEAAPVFQGPDILEDSSNLVANEEMTASGEWDFAPQEVWRLGSLGALPLDLVGNIHVDDDGSLYLLDRGSGEVAVLGAGGNLLRSFGGHGDGPLFQYPVKLFITPGYVHVLDMEANRDRIKTYDKSGRYVNTFDVEKGVSPRLFIDDETYAAVRSGSGILDWPEHELLELISLKQSSGAVLMRFPAEDKLILKVMVPMGRYIIVEDDIDIFPRLILHYDNGMLFLGRSDRYFIKKIDLKNGEQTAFSIKGRGGAMLPQGYAVSLAARKKVAGKDMTGETKERFLAGFPDRQTCYTSITTDDQGLIYVFVPDITDFGKQEIDIFSPAGKYIYHAVIRLPAKLQRVRPFVFQGKYLFVLVKDEKGEHHLVKYKIRTPEYF